VVLVAASWSLVGLDALLWRFVERRLLCGVSARWRRRGLLVAGRDAEACWRGPAIELVVNRVARSWFSDALLWRSEKIGSSCGMRPRWGRCGAIVVMAGVWRQVIALSRWLVARQAYVISVLASSLAGAGILRNWMRVCCLQGEHGCL